MHPADAANARTSAALSEYDGEVSPDPSPSDKKKPDDETR